MQLQVDELLQKEMDRKDFLKHVAFGVVALTGLGAAFKALSPKLGAAGGASYGASAYGGAKPAASATRSK